MQGEGKGLFNHREDVGLNFYLDGGDARLSFDRLIRNKEMVLINAESQSVRVA